MALGWASAREYTPRRAGIPSGVMHRPLWKSPPLLTTLVGAVLTALLWGRYLVEPTRWFFGVAAVAAAIAGVLTTLLASRWRLPASVTVFLIAVVLLGANFVVLVWRLGQSD